MQKTHFLIQSKKKSFLQYEDFAPAVPSFLNCSKTCFQLSIFAQILTSCVEDMNNNCKKEETLAKCFCHGFSQQFCFIIYFSVLYGQRIPTQTLMSCTAKRSRLYASILYIIQAKIQSTVWSTINLEPNCSQISLKNLILGFVSILCCNP